MLKFTAHVSPSGAFSPLSNKTKQKRGHVLSSLFLSVHCLQPLMLLSPEGEEAGLILAVMAFSDTLQWVTGVKEPSYGGNLTFQITCDLCCQYIFSVLQSRAEINNTRC